MEDIFAPWLRKEPRTKEETARLRERALATYAKLGYGPEVFTCDDCADRFICELVFDLFNTDGDCLLMK